MASRSDHEGKQMLRTERNRCRHTVAWSPSREHWPRAVCRNTGSVMCAGEGTTTGTAPRPCAGVGEGLPAGLRRSCPGPIAQRHAIHRTTTWCIGMTCRAGAPTGRRPKSTRLRNRLTAEARRRASASLLSVRCYGRGVDGSGCAGRTLGCLGRFTKDYVRYSRRPPVDRLGAQRQG
jgi:hypothetical protein